MDDDKGTERRWLSQLPAGTTAVVTAVRQQGEISQRLLEMGLTPGCRVKVVRFAPLGDPLDVLVRGYHLSLRCQEAALVEVTIPSKFRQEPRL